MDSEFGILKQIFTMGGPGVGLGFFMGWFFVSRKYMDSLLQVVKENTEAMTKLTSIIEGNKND